METTKKCNICTNPLHLIRLGPRHMPVWVHRGKELDTCTAFKLDKQLMHDLRTVMDNLSKLGPVKMKRNSKGEPVVFGEPSYERAINEQHTN